MNRYGLITVVLIAPALMFGCAKQPATMTTAAPAPTGMAVTGVSPTTARPESTESQPTDRSETSPLAADQRGGAGTSGTRPAPGEFVGVRDLVDVHFDFDKYAIRSRDAETLDANARWLRANKDAQVLIEGHCDERGTEEYNLALGDARAKQAKEYLAGLGLPGNELRTISYGKERPVCSDHDEACWQRNRRAHITQQQ